MACSPVAIPGFPADEAERRQKRKAAEIADSEEEDIEVGSEDDLGLPDEDFSADSNDEILRI